MGGRSSKGEVSYDVVEQSERVATDPSAGGNGNGSGSGSGSPSGSPTDSPGRSAAPLGHGHSPTPSLQFPSLSSETPMPMPVLFPAAAPAQTASSSSSPPSSPSSRPSGPLFGGSAEAPPTAVILASTHSFPSLRDWGKAPIPLSGHLSSPSVRLWENLPEIPAPASPPPLLPPPQQASPWAPVQQGPPPALPSGWAFDVDPASGFPYFYNSALRLSQWEDPRGRGWSLPDAGTSSSSQQQGHEEAKRPPWEGGGSQGNPLDWPLPPGWSQIEDPTSGRQYFVNYDAQLLLEIDPRILIAASTSQLRPAQGVPVSYPPPWADVPVATGQQPPLPVPEPPSPVTDSKWRPSPPAPIPGRQPNLWWKLGHGCAGGKLSKSAGGSRTSFLLFQNALVPGTVNHPVETKPRKKEKKHRIKVGGRRESGSSSSSSSDDNSSKGDALVGLTGVLQGLVEIAGNGDRENEDDTSSNHGSSSGDENDGNPDALLVASGMEAILAYGGAGPRDLPGGGRGGCGAGARVRSAPIVQPDVRYRSIRPRIPAGSNRVRHSGRKMKEIFRRPRFWDGFHRFVLSILRTVDSVCGFLLAVLCVMSLPTLWTFSLFSSKCASEISFFRRSRIWKAGRFLAHESRQYCFRRLLKMPHSRSSPMWRLTRWLASLCFKLQAGYYQHLCFHQHPKVKTLTAQDGAGPLQSVLPLDDREITIVTQASADRLPAIEAMAYSWGGPLCVAIYVRSKFELEQVYPRLCILHAQIEDRGLCKLHICVAIGEHENAAPVTALYPVNSMRNIALKMATTELVFLLDADFVPSPGLHESLTKNEDCYRRLLRGAKVQKKMFVVAAFESAGSCSFFELEDPSSRMPQSYEELKEIWCKGLGQGFHCGHFPRGHQPTDYDCFFQDSTSEPYMIPYREFYEPYVICTREFVPLFDERFTGYGLNKISHAYHCASQGMGFYVLPRHFVWAVPHPRSEAWSRTFGFNKDPLQILRVQGLYYQFKRELPGSEKKNNVGIGWRTKATLTRTVQCLLEVSSLIHQKLRARQQI